MTGLLTWHQGSILPYTSLWHIIRRVISLNSLSSQELLLISSKSRPKKVEVVFNDLDAQVDIGNLSALLGEDKETFNLSTLSCLNQSWRFLAHPNLRICIDCLNQGFHSTFFSLRLLAECPIHRTKLRATCSCGRPFPSLISSSYFLTPHCCPCGGTLFFSKETCRRPTLSANETAAFTPIFEWLSKISTCFRPSFGDGDEMRLYETEWLEGAARWSEHLNLEYPDAFDKFQGPSMRQVITSSSGRLQNQYRRCPDHGDKPRVLDDSRNWRIKAPSLLTYLAMSKYIRKHVSRRTDYWVSKFAQTRDAVKIAELLKKSTEAKIAFTEMLWARHVEDTVQWRRWPYRRPGGSVNWRIFCEFHAKGVSVATGNVLTEREEKFKCTRDWVEYHSTEAFLLAVWRAAWDQTERCAASGIADWCEIEMSVQTQMSWLSTFDPNDPTKSRFILEADPVGRLPVLFHSNANERKVKARELAKASTDLVSSACKVPCLTWTEGDGLHVREGTTPVSGYRTHKVLFKEGYHAKGWLFQVRGHYVLRLIDIRLQVFGETPKEAFEAMRHCVKNHLKGNTDKFSFPRKKLEKTLTDQPRNPHIN